jgi:hypothetical protein
VRHQEVTLNWRNFLFSPSADHWSDHAIRRSIRRFAPKPRGSRPSIAVFTAAGANAVEAHGKIESEMVGATVSAPSPDDLPARRILGMLSTDKGATLEELTDATGWLPHTARAALTGLRKRGYDVHLVRGGRETAAVYRTTTLNAEGSR